MGIVYLRLVVVVQHDLVHTVQLLAGQHRQQLPA